MSVPRTASTGLVLFLLFLGGCSSMNVGSQQVEDAALAKVKIFALVVAPQDKVPMDPALRDFLGKRIAPAIVAEMTAKGSSEAPEASADVLVATQAFIGVADVGAIRWNPTVVTWYPWGPVSTGFFASSSIGKEISFVIDVGNLEAQELYWRGWAAGAVEVGAQHDPRKARRLVGAVLAGLPKAKGCRGGESESKARPGGPEADKERLALARGRSVCPGSGGYAEARGCPPAHRVARRGTRPGA